MTSVANAVLMVRPRAFGLNPETGGDNHYQVDAGTSLCAVELAQRARREVDAVANVLTARSVTVHMLEEQHPPAPDSVFANNWFSTDPDGRVVLYPLRSPRRRAERRPAVIRTLSSRYRVREVVDLTHWEHSGLYLEGTGALVFDYENRTAYVGLSARASEPLVQRFGHELGYETVTFRTCGPDGRPIYHTNVVLSVGKHFALVGFSMIPCGRERALLRRRLERTGKCVIELAPSQVGSFAGNCIELQSLAGSLLLMSTRAYESLNEHQRCLLSEHTEVEHVDVPTIELSGGSARCMIAGIHLAPLAHRAGIPAQRWGHAV